MHACTSKKMKSQRHSVKGYRVTREGHKDFYTLEERIPEIKTILKEYPLHPSLNTMFGYGWDSSSRKVISSLKKEFGANAQTIWVAADKETASDYAEKLTLEEREKEVKEINLPDNAVLIYDDGGDGRLYVIPETRSVSNASPAPSSPRELLGTHRPIQLEFYKNTAKAPFLGDRFGQTIEPAGEYIGTGADASIQLPGFVYGTISFKKPLYIEYKTTGMDGWKKDVSEKYGKTGKALSKAIIKDGFDGIITIDSESNEIREIVNLAGKKRFFPTVDEIADEIIDGIKAEEVESESRKKKFMAQFGGGALTKEKSKEIEDDVRREFRDKRPMDSY
jgi:hypothetical protein